MLKPAPLAMLRKLLRSANQLVPHDIIYILIHESSHFLGFGAFPLIQPFLLTCLFCFCPCLTSFCSPFHSQSPTGIGFQYVPNGIQLNSGVSFQPNQPQLVAYPQQAQAAAALQGMGLVQAQKLQFLSAAPRGVLGSGAAVVDCPRCGVRAVTRTSYVSGNTT